MHSQPTSNLGESTRILQKSYIELRLLIHCPPINVKRSLGGVFRAETRRTGGPARIGRGRPRFRKEEKPRCAGAVKGGIFG